MTIIGSAPRQRLPLLHWLIESKEPHEDGNEDLKNSKRKKKRFAFIIQILKDTNIYA